MAALSDADRARIDGGTPAPTPTDTSRFQPTPNRATAGGPEPEPAPVETPAPAAPAAPAPDASATPADPALKLAPAPEAPAAVDWRAFSVELATKGELSPESFAKVKQALPALPDEMISAYVEGQKALIEKTRAQGFALVGGEENYTAMAVWASKNLSQEELDAYNEAIDRNPASMKMAVQGLRARYESTVEPNLARRQTGNAPQGEPALTSRAQFRALVSDPRYAKDPEFRRDATRRLAQAMQQGTLRD